MEPPKCAGHERKKQRAFYGSGSENGSTLFVCPGRHSSASSPFDSGVLPPSVRIAISVSPSLSVYSSAVRFVRSLRRGSFNSHITFRRVPRARVHVPAVLAFLSFLPHASTDPAGRPLRAPVAPPASRRTVAHSASAFDPFSFRASEKCVRKVKLGTVPECCLHFKHAGSKRTLAQ